MRRLKRIIDWLHYDLPYGIQNLIKFFPLVWNDRNWDWAYLYRLMQFKLEGMAKDTRKFGYHTNDIRYARHMELTAKVLGRLIEDDYLLSNKKGWQKREARDKKFVFDMMRKYSKGWWY